MGRLMPDNAFPESCCDGGECALDDNSCQPCGCDKGAKWMCDRHAAEFAAKRGVTMRGEEDATVRVIDYQKPQQTFRCNQCGLESPHHASNCVQFGSGRALVEGNDTWPLPSPFTIPLHVKPQIGPGGAPTRATSLPTDGSERKKYPVASGVLDYFPDALVAVSKVSWAGNEQHNPGQSLRWDRSKSQDEADTMMRHFLQRGTVDIDGTRHSAKMVWRALAILQKEIEDELKVKAA